MAPTTPAAEDLRHGGHRVNRRRVALIAISFPVYFLLLMFLPAGTFEWTAGWIFLAVLFATMAVAWFVLWKFNPELIIARSQPHSGTQPWDLVLFWFLLPSIYAIVPISACDAAGNWRFQFPLSLYLTGYVLFVAGFFLVGWAQLVNKFFEPTVRIQTDRGHTVITTGPYALIRHPGYAGMIPLMIGVPLCLGSLWGLVPAIISNLIIVIRTGWEDQTLQTELVGYADYARRVRWKLIPGIW